MSCGYFKNKGIGYKSPFKIINNWHRFIYDIINYINQLNKYTIPTIIRKKQKKQKNFRNDIDINISEDFFTKNKIFLIINSIW